MSVVTVQPAYDESGDESEDGYSFDRAWIVVVDSLTDDAYTVLEGPGIPRKGDLHRTGRAQVIGRKADRIEESLGWLVTISYGQPEGGTGGDDGGGDPDDPANVKPTMRIVSSHGSIVKSSDFFNNPLTNSAGDASGSDEFDETETVIRIDNHTVSFATVKPELLAFYAGAVHGNDFVRGFFRDDVPENLGADNFPKFLNLPVHKWRTRLTNFDFGTTRQEDFILSGKTRWSVSLEFTIRRTWLGSDVDDGFNETDLTEFALSGGRLESIKVEGYRPVLDKQGVPVRRPVMLNGNGVAVVQPAPPGVPTPPWFLVYQKYPHRNLNDLLKALLLPQTLAGYNFK